MPRTTKVGFLPTSLTSALTVGAASNNHATFVALTLHNVDTVDRLATVKFVPSGGAEGDADFTIIGHQANETVLEADETQVYRWQPNLNGGDAIWWMADSASAISARLAVEERVDADRIGKDAAFASDSLQTIYTVTSGKNATMIEITLHNTDTSARFYTIHFVPNGGSAGNDNLIREPEGNKIEPGETRIIRENPFLNPSDFVQIKADVASKVVQKVSAIEESI